MELNSVDLLILAVVASAVLHGLGLGAAVQVLSFAGVVGGLALGAAAAPAAAGLVRDPGAKAVVSLAVIFAAPLVCSTVGRELGVRLWGRFRRRPPLVVADQLLGGAVGAAASVLACWLAASMLATVPIPEVSGEIQRSTILRAVDARLPPAPDVFARLQRLLAPQGFPQVFAELEPRPAPPLALPGDPAVRAAAARAAPSTVKIVGEGCGGQVSGSGFVAAPGLVVTNAHVVAGINRPVVIAGGSRTPASPVVFDPDLDVAVLRVSGLSRGALPLATGTVARGTTGAVVGYPGGGPLDAQGAVVVARYTAVGRDIYGRELTTRDVYELRSRVRPGNSGGPVVAPDGTVIGVVFSRSARHDAVGYALTAPQVRSRLSTAQQRGGPVSTGPCPAG